MRREHRGAGRNAGARTRSPGGVLASILVWEAKQGRPRSPAGLHALIRERPIRRPAREKARDKLDALIEKLGTGKGNAGRR